MKHCLSLFLAALVVSLSAQGQLQKINTFAGLGTAGFSGDGMAATGAQFNGPYSVTIDQAGTVYVADFFNSRVRKITPTGTITTIAGNGSAGWTGDGSIATSANMLPDAVMADKSGNLYIADGNANVIRKVNPSGIITTIAGTGGVSGNTGDGGPAVGARLNKPHGMTFDHKGRLIIADAANHNVRMITAGGQIFKLAGKDTAGYTGDGGFATNAKLDSPFAVAADKKGNVYISDILRNVIRRVDSFGVITTFAGDATGMAGYSGDNGPATSAQLNRPAGIAVDSVGNLYIADANNNVIRKVDTFGVIRTVAGNGTFGFSGDLGFAIGANLYHPYDVAVDGAGSLYIADANNHRIRKTYFTTSVPRLAGRNLSCYPNPAADMLVVEGLESGDIVEVYNMPGQLITTVTAGKATATIPTAQLVPGVYMLSVKGDGVTRVVTRFVKD